MASRLGFLVLSPPADRRGTRTVQSFAAEPPDISRLVEAVRSGDAGAQDALIRAVYADLHRTAERYMAAERPSHTLQPTALVNEALIRLTRGGVLDDPRSRGFFFAAASRAMRQVLVDHARARRTAKGPGRWVRSPLDDFIDDYASRQLDLLDLNDSLEALHAVSPMQSEIMNLRYFGGFAVAEIAELLGLGVSTVESHQRQARAFLSSRLKGANE